MKRKRTGVTVLYTCLTMILVFFIIVGVFFAYMRFARQVDYADSWRYLQDVARFAFGGSDAAEGVAPPAETGTPSPQAEDTPDLAAEGTEEPLNEVKFLYTEEEAPEETQQDMSWADLLK